MDNEKKPTRAEIVRSLHICSTALMEGCGGCVFVTTGHAACSDTLYTVAADLIDELTDRCARYAEEIMELKEQLRKYRLAEGLAAAQNESGPCPFARWCDAVQAANNNNEKEKQA